MGTSLGNAEKRSVNVLKMQEQLDAWALKLAELEASNLRAGAQTHDAYPTRIADLRTRLEAVQGRLRQYEGAPGPLGPWNALQASIALDWTALEEGMKELAP